MNFLNTSNDVLLWYVNIFMLDFLNIGEGSRGGFYILLSNVFNVEPISINMFISLLPICTGYVLFVDLRFILNI